jgi:hypothetical protein
MSRITKDPENPATFSPPLETVREQVKTVAYGDRVREKQAQTNALKGHGKPLGGAAPIPEGKLSPLAMPLPDFSTEEPPDEMARLEKKQRLEAQQAAAQQLAMTGVGSAYTVNQKLMKGEHSRPVSLAEAKKDAQSPRGPKISPQTAEALKKMDEAVRAQTKDEQDEGPPQPVLEPPSDDSDRKDLDDADKDLRKEEVKLDFEGIIQARNALMSEERRKRIEKRLKELDIDDMIRNREITQTIPVVPGKLELTLRTFSQKEHLWCMQYIYEHIGSDSYQNELFNTCKVVCSLIAINGKPLTEHRNKVGERGEEVDRKKFDSKLDQLIGFPVQLIADISVQLIWFNARVNKLFDLDTLKNG